MNDLIKRFAEKPAVIIASALTLFCGLNIVTGLATDGIRADVTQDGVHSVSAAAASLAQKTPEPVTLKLYFSAAAATDFPAVQDRAKRVRHYLNALENASGGKIGFEYVNVEPFSEIEDEAVARGLRGIPLPDGRMLYFGLTGENTIDGSGVIPFFTPDRDAYLEYDTARLIDGLSGRTRPTVGLLSALPLSTGAGGLQAVLKGQEKPYAIYAELKNAYNVELLDPDLKQLKPDGKKNIPDIVALIHPRPLSEKAQKTLTDYLAKGGRIVLALDPLSEAPIMQDSALAASRIMSSGAPELLEGWGVTFSDDKVLLDPVNAKRGIDQNTGKIVDYLAWLNLPLNVGKAPTDPMISRLKSLSFGTSGFFEQATLPEGITYTVLAHTSDEARFVNRDELLAGGALNAANAKKEDIKQYDVIVKLTGSFGKAADKDTFGTVILVGDSDFFDDRYWLKAVKAGAGTVGAPFADNGNFILNAVDYLSGSEELISLRGRKVTERPFTYLQAIRADAEKQYRDKEKALNKEIADAQARLDKLRERADVLSDAEIAGETRAEIDSFTRKLLQNRKELREVRRNLNQDMRETGAWLKILNIGLLPVLIGLAPALWLLVRKFKRNQAARLSS